MGSMATYLRARIRKAGSRRWRGDVSWLTRGFGGKLSAAHWRRYLYVAVTGATANRSLYFLSSSPDTCKGITFIEALLLHNWS